ncbi:MAG: response regulator [Candidatus Omnitrophica bacterium]|nr:response regulator [Candidatus Omnitrophota bacterium]
MKKILVVDDDTFVRRMLSLWCAAQGYETLEADNGLAALDLACRYRPDLVISDVAMPGMGGYALLSALRAMPDTEDIPVLMISGQPRPACERVKPDGFLQKPFQVSNLKALIQVSLGLTPQTGRESNRL